MKYNQHKTRRRDAMAINLFPSMDKRISDWVESKRRDKIEHRKRLNCFTITLSREFGCEAYPLAVKLKKLLEKTTEEDWNIFDRALIEKVRLENGLNEEFLFNLSKQAGFTEKLIAERQPSWKKNTEAYEFLAKAIYSISSEGHAIIVGCGAAVITQHIRRTYHFRLVAPEKFRIKSIARRAAVPYSEAEKVVSTRHKERKRFFKNFLQSEVIDLNYYHAVYNNDKLSVERIAENIVATVKSLQPLSCS
jgi:cytidylate kinase